MVGIQVDISGLSDWMNAFEADGKRKAMMLLAEVGETYVNDARSLPSPPASMRGKPHQPNYIDETSNLRNANSYEVYDDGQSVFQAVGRPETRAFFDREKDGDGIEILMGNGMEYASHLEGKGYEVASGPFVRAEDNLRKKFA